MIFKGENSKYGLKDENGNVLVEPIFDDIQDFTPDGYAKVKIGKKNEIIDQKGNFVFLDKKSETDQTSFDEGLKYLEVSNIKDALSKFKKADTDDALLLMYELHKTLGDNKMTEFVSNRLKERLVSRSLKEEHKKIFDSISPAVFEQIRRRKMATYKGFDYTSYPGKTFLQNWWLGTPFYISGFYLGPAPTHSDISYMDKKAEMEQIGYGLIPIYVGRQSTGLTEANGRTDAQDAATLARNAGFTDRGTILYLDIEPGGILSTEAVELKSNKRLHMDEASYSVEGLKEIFGVSRTAGHFKKWIIRLDEISGLLFDGIK